MGGRLHFFQRPNVISYPGFAIAGLMRNVWWQRGKSSTKESAKPKAAFRFYDAGPMQTAIQPTAASAAQLPG
jgi:hypothetical protein